MTVIIKRLEEGFTADLVCQDLHICTGQCRLFPKPKEEQLKASRATGLPRALPKICDLPGIKEIVGGWERQAGWCRRIIVLLTYGHLLQCDIINNFGEYHDPIDDIDKDYFSPLQTLRGIDWWVLVGPQ